MDFSYFSNKELGLGPELRVLPSLRSLRPNRAAWKILNVATSSTDHSFAPLNTFLKSASSSLRAVNRTACPGHTVYGVAESIVSIEEFFPCCHGICLLGLSGAVPEH